MHREPEEHRLRPNIGTNIGGGANTIVSAPAMTVTVAAVPTASMIRVGQ